MGRHKLAYKLKKPNKDHKYWRYTLSNDPKSRYVSARIRGKRRNFPAPS
jgi:ribosomal protein S6